MVHSAGVGVLKNVEDITVEEWHFVHHVNLHGPFLGIKHGLPRMRAHAPGSIVIISSVSGIIAGHNLSAYNTSKAPARPPAKTTARHWDRKSVGWGQEVSVVVETRDSGNNKKKK